MGKGDKIFYITKDYNKTTENVRQYTDDLNSNYCNVYANTEIDFDYEGYEQYEYVQNKMIQEGLNRNDCNNTAMIRNRSSDFQLYRGNSEEVRNKTENNNFRPTFTVINEITNYTKNDNNNKEANFNNESNGFADENSEESKYNFPNNFN